MGSHLPTYLLSSLHPHFQATWPATITTASRQTKAITKVATIKVRLNSNTARHQVHGINMAASKVTAHTHHKIKATVRLLHSTATIRATTKVLLKRSMDSSLPTTNSATIHRTHQQVSMLRTVRHSRANMLDQEHMPILICHLELRVLMVQRASAV